MTSPYLTNPTNSNVYPFTDITNPASVNCRALPEPINNIAAVKGLIGGTKSKKQRINNISNMYKMKGSRKSVSRRIRRIKSKLRSKYGIKSRKIHSRKNCTRKNCRIHHMKGGYSQYMNNVPNTPNFSTGGPLSPSLSALANPVTFNLLPNNSIDNLNHNALNSFGNSGSGMGFPSRGSF